MPIAPPASIGRRGFLGGAGATAVLLGTGALDSGLSEARADAPSYPFALGVASGDPLPNSVVLWTRLAIDPLAPDGSGGMAPRPVPVRWEVAEDERFRRIVRRGTATATPALGHSVHPEVWGLRPGRTYWFRFRAGQHVSPVGRTRTAPSHAAHLRELSFAFASCARWDQGFYTAYGHLADEDLDLVVHLGDYLYEYGINATGGARKQPMAEAFRGETTDLARYRLQYGLYKSDPNLMAAHAAHPFVVTPDDHEVENNWASDTPEESSQSKGPLWLPRRTAAFQAYYENLPFRAASVPQGADMRIYRRLAYGDLLDFNVIDTRQFRADQLYGDGTHVPGPEVSDPARTMMGFAQERWLLDNLARHRPRWQVIANQAPMAETDQDAGPGKLLSMDPWDGYRANRERILGGAVERDVDNLVVITGDRHQNYASDLHLDYDRPDSAIVGSEFVGTSITSGGDGADMTTAGQNLLAANPHLRFFNSQRGYVRCKVTRKEWSSDFRVIPYVTRPDAPVSTRATYVVEAGVPGVQLDVRGKVVGRAHSANAASEADLDETRAR